MPRTLHLAFSVLALVVLGGCRTTAVPAPAVPVPDGLTAAEVELCVIHAAVGGAALPVAPDLASEAQMSDEEVEQVFGFRNPAGGSNPRWHVTGRNRGSIFLTAVREPHILRLEIRLGGGTVRPVVSYAENLSYDGRRIHETGALWIDALLERVARDLEARRRDRLRPQVGDGTP